MPSPIAHGAAGFLLHRSLRRRLPEGCRGVAGALLLVAFSLLPDLDFVPGLLLGDLEGWHNQASHSFAFGVLAAVPVAAVVARLAGGGFGLWYLVALLGYQGHVVMDYFTWGRGVKLLWPFSDLRWAPPVTLFYGVRWSEGWHTPLHLVTVATELVLWLPVWLLAGRRRGCASA